MIISNSLPPGFPQHKFGYARLCWWSDDWMVYHLGDNTSKQDKRATLEIRGPKLSTPQRRNGRTNKTTGILTTPLFAF